MRIPDRLEFVGALCRNRLFDAIEPRFNFFASVLGSGIGILTGLLHGARGGGGVLPGLLNGHEHRPLLFLEFLVRRNDVLGPLGTSFGRLIFARRRGTVLGGC